MDASRRRIRELQSPTTHGHCEALVTGRIDEGNFNDTRLDGLNWALLLYWPGEIADGNGKQQAIIDERGDADQREALRKILHGESTAPGATHFFVYNSTMSEVLDTLYAPVDLSIDVDGRTANVKIGDLVTSVGVPIISRFNGQPVRSRINLPNGFEYTFFNVLYMNQDGVIR